MSERRPVVGFEPGDLVMLRSGSPPLHVDEVQRPERRIAAYGYFQRPRRGEAHHLRVAGPLTSFEVLFRPPPAPDFDPAPGDVVCVTWPPPAGPGLPSFLPHLLTVERRATRFKPGDAVRVICAWYDPREGAVFSDTFPLAILRPRPPAG